MGNRVRLEDVAHLLPDGDPSKPPPRGAKGRRREREMNGTEARYAAVLETRRHAGEVAWWAYEAVQLRLADRCTYLPDFLVMLADGSIEVHEVKGGFARDDAIVKLKVAADLYPFTFRLCRYRGRKWEVAEV